MQLMFFRHDGFFVAVDPNIQLPNIIHHEIFGELASTQPEQILFICFACICLCLTPELDENGIGASINTVSEEAHGLSDPLVNLHGGCRGHCRGQRSAFMHITNNAAFLPTAQAAHISLLRKTSICPTCFTNRKFFIAYLYSSTIIPNLNTWFT